jgi:transcriptional regulator with XRE-family HTH domain
MRKTIPKDELHSPSLMPQVLASLKLQYRARGIKYRDVAKALKISEITVKRYLSGQALTVDMLERLCQVADLNIFDLIELAREQQNTLLKELEPEQEERLAREPFMSVVYFLLRRGWAVEEIKKDFRLSEADVAKYLTALDGLDLIDLYPFNKVRVKAGRAVALHSPLKRLFRSLGVQKDFSDFDPESEEVSWIFNYYKLSPASLDHVKKLAEKLNAAAAEISHNDHRIPGNAARWYGIMNIIRPFDHDRYRPAPKREKQK